VQSVFHVSQLKKAVGSKVAVSSLPQELSELQVLEKVLQHRLINRGVRSVLQGLIQWSSAPTSLAMWEDLEALHQHFLAAPAWVKQELMKGEMSVPLVLRAHRWERRSIKEWADMWAQGEGGPVCV
jgi:hypothetical protein